MQLVLRSARRLEREIEGELQLVNNSIQTRSVNISLYENFEAKIASIQTDVVDALDKGFRLAEIRFKIRKAIETANEVTGLNLLINEEALLKAKQKLLLQATGPELTTAEQDVAQKRHGAMVTSGATTGHYGQVTDAVAVGAVLTKVTLDKIKAQSKDVQKRLLKLVDLMTAINTSKTVEIDDGDIAYLEANGFVI